MSEPTLDRHIFATGFVALAVTVCLAIVLLSSRQAIEDLEDPKVLVALFPPGEPARTSRDTIREVGALPRRVRLGGMLVSFVAWHAHQIEQLERSGAFTLALPSQPEFALGCIISTLPGRRSRPRPARAPGIRHCFHGQRCRYSIFPPRRPDE